MKISRSFALYVVMVCLIFLGAASAWSQTNFNVKLYVEDGSGWKDSVYVGKYTSATDAIGDSIDPVLVENELPPLPPSGVNQAPDLRLDDPLGGGAYGQGVRVDLRHLVTDGQTNTYRMKFRRSDPDGSVITISWPAGLNLVGGGGWYLTDGFGGFLFPPVDMTAQTSFQNAFYNGISGGFVDIVSGDGSMMRTFTADSIALAADLKGKVGKYQKPKPISVDFKFKVNAPAGGADQFYVEFDKIVNGTVSFEDDPDSHAPIPILGLKKYTVTIPDSVLKPTAKVVVEGNGIKGKPMKAKYYFLLSLVKTAKTEVPKPYDSNGGYEWLRLPMPNPNNIGDELYLELANLGVGVPTSIGLTEKLAPIIHHISLPKWKDVTKTLYKFKNVTILQNTTPAWCLDTLKSKLNIKMLKSLAPDKTIRIKDSNIFGNKLIGELIALKFNIAASDNGHTPATGFGDLLYTGPAPDDASLVGRTVNQIAAYADSALACANTGVSPAGTFTYTELADFLATLNAEFSGPWDTASWSGVQTVASGIKSVALSSIFTSAGPKNAPIAPADYSSLYGVPDAFALGQNYPNPFNPTTTIEFTIPEDAVVTLKVFNMLGQEVATLADREEFTAGQNWVELDASNLSTGVYYYRIVVNDNQFTDVRKMVLMK